MNILGSDLKFKCMPNIHHHLAKILPCITSIYLCHNYHTYSYRMWRTFLPQAWIPLCIHSTSKSHHCRHCISYHSWSTYCLWDWSPPHIHHRFQSQSHISSNDSSSSLHILLLQALMLYDMSSLPGSLTPQWSKECTHREREQRFLKHSLLWYLEGMAPHLAKASWWTSCFPKAEYKAQSS